MTTLLSIIKILKRHKTNEVICRWVLIAGIGEKIQSRSLYRELNTQWKSNLIGKGELFSIDKNWEKLSWTHIQNNFRWVKILNKNSSECTYAGKSPKLKQETQKLSKIRCTFLAMF